MKNNITNICNNFINKTGILNAELKDKQIKLQVMQEFLISVQEKVNICKNDVINKLNEISQFTWDKVLIEELTEVLHNLNYEVLENSISNTYILFKVCKDNIVSNIVLKVIFDNGNIHIENKGNVITELNDNNIIGMLEDEEN